MNKFILTFLILLFPYVSFAADITGTVKDWLGNTMSGATTYVYAFGLTGSGSSTHLDGNAYIASTSTITGNYTLTGLTSSTEYFIIYIRSTNYTAADGKTYSNIVGTDFKTAQ